MAEIQDLESMEEGMLNGDHSGPSVVAAAAAAAGGIIENNANVLDKCLIGSVIDQGRNHSDAQRQEPQMQKVSQRMRQRKDNDRFFDPAVVSIGPYHHGKEELKAAEDLKPRVAFELTRRRPEDFYKKISEKISEVLAEAKSCYLEDSINNYDDDAFLKMMFLDGCFILHFWEHPSLFYRHLGRKSASALFTDIILLENQLPFVVLQAFMDLMYPEDGGEGLINSRLNFYLGFAKRRATWRGNEGDKFLHLLQILRSKLIFDIKSNSDQTRSPKDGGKKEFRLRQHFFRSAIEIKRKGIHCKPSNTNFVTDISFVSHFLYAELKLPQITIGPYAKHVFFNIIAYETAPNTPTKLEVSTYIFFMDCLIDGVEDVRELRSQKLIRHYQSSDEEVVKMFIDTGAETMWNLYLLEEVINKIQNHYDKQINTWVAQVVHDHFSTPWSVVAFLVAIFVIVLTIVQTYFAIYPRS
ncbi:UPF0481 protein At3g47200-like [Malania oleifera]|uniref:UPF0481 protein At3g47200-like n=1 Tax=Malania oleifera TaxID=397392 RepID=UPI0025AEBA92|nr:UPF0481 protein At3g47200-like [Malania oleifera]